MKFALLWLSIIATFPLALTTNVDHNNERINLSTMSTLDPTGSVGPPLHPHPPTQDTLPPTETEHSLSSTTTPASHQIDSTTSSNTTDDPGILIDPHKRNGLFLQHPAVPFTLDPEKHFHEATFDNHYDGRFASGPIPTSAMGQAKRHSDLRKLVVAYLKTMKEIGIETWLMHGTLLGWWWGGRILKWDFDADVQVTNESAGFLGRYYNMSLWNFDNEGMRKDNGGAMALPPRDSYMNGTLESEFGKYGRTYLLEINPHHTLHDGSPKSDKNVIDGRWIDTSTGLYVDITCLWKAVDHEAGSGILTGKDGHSYREKYIFPLRETSFEGVDAMIPNAYIEVLSKEYGPMALVKANYKGHVFDEEIMEWVSLTPNSTLLEAESD